MRKATKRKIVKRLALLVFGLAVGLTLAEVGAHLREQQWLKGFNQYNAQNVNSFRTDHLVYHHGFIPNAQARVRTQEYDIEYRINSLGMRDEEMDHGKYKVLVLGDSYTEGFGVNKEDSIPGYLDTLGINADFLNAGVASFSAMLYYLYAKARLDEIKPRLVLVFLDANDPADDYMTLHGLHQGQFERKPLFNEAGELTAVQPLHGGDQLKGKAKDQAKEAAEKYARKLRAARPVRAFLRRNSALFRLFTGDFDSSPKLAPERLGDPLIDRYGHYRPMKGQDWKPLYNVSLRYLVKLRDLLKPRGIKLAVVTYPYAVAISPDEWDVGRTRWLFEVGKVYNTDFFEYFDKELKAKGIPHLSLLDYLRTWKEKHPGERIYFRWDGHFNPAGNKLVAGRVYRWLIERGLVPAGDAAGAR